MTENEAPKITRQTVGGSSNAPIKAQESVNAPSREFLGTASQNAPVTTAARGKQVSYKITAND